MEQSQGNIWPFLPLKDLVVQEKFSDEIDKFLDAYN
jgi:hypothetical protein